MNTRNSVTSPTVRCPASTRVRSTTRTPDNGPSVRFIGNSGFDVYLDHIPRRRNRCRRQSLSNSAAKTAESRSAKRAAAIGSTRPLS